MAMNASMPAPVLASLYVGDLHTDVSEAQLFERFSSIGAVLSIRVCRDMMSRRSLGYAYVNFQNTADAEKAMNRLNFDILEGRPMRIMWSQRDPSLRRSGHGNIFIKNLDKAIDHKALHDTFTAFGPILSCKVATDESGISKGYGFVHFETKESATQAIEKVNGMLLNDRKVFVGIFKCRRERIEEGGNRQALYTNVYVKNLPDDFNDEKLHDLFSKFGKIVSAKVMVDDKGKARGFGFCSFESPADAERAVQELNEKELGKTPLYVGRAQKKAERLAELNEKFHKNRQDRMKNFQGTNLYIKNLEDSVDDEKLRQGFSKYGTITSAKVMLNENNVSKGFGFVCFSTQEEASAALSEMNGHMFENKPLFVALAQRKEDRRNQLATHFTHRRNPMMPQAGQHLAYGPPLMMPYHQGQRPFPIPSQMPATMRPRNWGTGMPRGQSVMHHQFPAGMQNRPRNNRNFGNRAMGGMQQGPRQGRVPSQPRAQRGAYSQRPQTGPAQVPAGGPAPSAEGAHPAGTIPDVKQLHNSSAQEQKQMLGEYLFPQIFALQPEQAGKITGMLLEIDNSEILHMLESKDALRAKVDEAVEVLKAHNAGQGKEAPASK